jgi:hypothetical protein
MRLVTALALAASFLFCFVAVWSAPLNASGLVRMESTAEKQTVSGKITFIGDGEFLLEVKQDQNQNTMKFLIDDNTKADGKLSVGAHASVDYRSEGGTNIATQIRVTPS